MASTSFCSNGSTQPFSEVSQPGADLEQLILSLPTVPDEGPSSGLDLGLCRIFARSHGPKHILRIATYPEAKPAAVLDHDILAVSQSTQSIRCDINIPAAGAIPGLEFRLYFNPCSDVLTAENITQHAAVRLQQIKPAQTSTLLNPLESAYLEPGTWRLLSTSLPDASAYVDLYLKPRSFCTVPKPVATQRTGSKRRPAQVEGSLGPATAKKQKAPGEARHVLQAASSVTHPLLQLQDGQTVQMIGDGRNNYSLRRRNFLASTASATLYTAQYSLRPGQVVVTKALRPSAPEEAPMRALQWLREVSTHKQVGEHSRIASFYGCDARGFTIYMEHIDSPALSEIRDRSDMCTCQDAAFTILSDLAPALQHIHALGLIHNDVKPSNILFHPTRGAILIDFGLGTKSTEKPSNGGTPWYLPPEFMSLYQRGPLADVFALGLTMLWVLRKCSLPDTGRQWNIGDINAQGYAAAERRARARTSMQKWLRRLEEMRLALYKSEQSIEHVVGYMLCEQKDRIGAVDVISRLKSVSL